MGDLWNYKFDWFLNTGHTSGVTWEKVNRLDKYRDSPTIHNLEDTYFKYQQCVSGVCYQYVLDIRDIYNRSIMVGGNEYLKFMYNEYDVINEFMNNFTYVDTYSADNIDITQKITQLNNIPLKSTHRIILINQDDKTENDIYSFDIGGNLTRTDDLSTTGTSYRYGVHARLDNNTNIEFFLRNTGDTFPISDDVKYFDTGHTFIIKHIFKYNINNTGTSYLEIPKLWFTDYDFARKLNKNNDSFYNDITFTNAPSTGITIYYRDNYESFTVDGFVNYNTSNFTGTTWYSGTTQLETNSTFTSNCDPNDYLYITMTGITSGETINVFFNSKIKSIYGNYIELNEYIPNYILDGYNSDSGMTYLRIENLNKLSSADWPTSIDILNNHFYGKFYTITGTTFPINISAKKSKFDRYIDYDSITFYMDTTAQTFDSNNYYIDYKLYEHLNSINSTVFNSDFILYSGFTITNFTSAYTYLLDDSSYPQTTTDLDSPIKITPTSVSDLNNFYNHTLVGINTNYKAFIIDKGCDYITIEHPTGLTTRVTSIKSLYSLSGMSETLYDVYRNIDIYSGSTNDYYNKKDNEEIKRICKAYSEILSKDSRIMEYTTGTIYPDNRNRFILKLYNERYSGNTYLSSGFTNDILYYNDENLTLRPVELIDIGIDKHTKMPLPILPSNILISDTMVSGHTISIDLNYLEQSMKLVNGLTVEKIKIKYGWLFNASFKNAVIGENEYGLVWYMGDWYCGEWINGSWYSGTWYDGIWRNGRWYSYLIDKKELFSYDRFKSLDDNKKYSKFLNGVWRNGNWYNGIFGDDVSITGYTSKVFLNHINILPNNLNVTVWKNGNFYNGEFKNSIWETGLFLYGEMYGGYWKNGQFYNGTFDGNWWNGTFLSGDFKSGIWENGIFTSMSKSLSRFGYNTLSTSSTTTEWWNGSFNNSEFYTSTGITLDVVNNNKSHWYFGTFKNSKFYGGHFFTGIFNNSTFYNGVFGTENTDILISGSSIFQSGEFLNGLWIDGEFLDGNFRNGIFMNGTFHKGSLRAVNPPSPPTPTLNTSIQVTPISSVQKSRVTL